MTARPSGGDAASPCDELLVWNGVVERVAPREARSTSLVALAAAVAFARDEGLSPDLVRHVMRLPCDRRLRERGA